MNTLSVWATTLDPYTLLQLWGSKGWGEVEQQPKIVSLQIKESSNTWWVGHLYCLGWTSTPLGPLEKSQNPFKLFLRITNISMIRLNQGLQVQI